MIKKILLIVAFILTFAVSSTAEAAPAFRLERTLIPEIDSTYDLGTTTRAWLNVFTDRLCLSGDCKTAWPSSGGTPGGSDTQVQFNDSGSFGGDSGFTFNKTTDLATLLNLSLTNGTSTNFHSNKFSIPITTSSILGVINLGVDRFIHAFGTSNMFAGKDSGNFTLSGATNNSGFGENTLGGLTSGDRNSAGGWSSLSVVGTGSDNSAWGRSSLGNVTSGSGNSGFGMNAGQRIESGSNNTFLGYETGSSAVTPTNLSNATAIGYNTNVGCSNCLILGTGADVGIGTTTPGARLHAISTTEQFRLGYDSSNYLSTTIGSTGIVSLDAIGSGSIFNFADTLLVPDGSLTIPAIAAGTDSDDGLYWDASDNLTFVEDGQAWMSLGANGQIRSHLVGTAATPAYTFSADLNTGIYKTSSGDVDSLSITTGGVQRMVIDSSGNVGIASSTPSARLVVAGQTIGEYFTATSTTIASTFPLASTTALSVSGSAYITSMTSGSILFAGTAGLVSQDNSNFFWDDTNNRLGIGVASPSAKLQVVGATDVVQELIRGHSTQTNDLIQWQNSASFSGMTFNMSSTASSIFLRSASHTGSSDIGKIIMKQDVNYAPGSAMYILPPSNGGRIFFGDSTTPSYAELNFTYIGAFTATPALFVRSTVTSHYGTGAIVGTAGAIDLTIGSAAAGGLIRAPSGNGDSNPAFWFKTFDDSTKNFASIRTAGQYVFDTNVASASWQSGQQYMRWNIAGVTQMLMDGSGNLGIGATPSARLHVIKTTEQFRLGYDTSNYLSSTVGSTGSVTLDAIGSGSAFTFSDKVTIQPPAGAGTNPALVVASSTATAVFTVNGAGHMITGGGTPAVSSCGTSPSISGNDTAGTVTVGSGVVVACTITFNTPRLNTPRVVGVVTGGGLNIVGSYSAKSTTAVTFSFAATVGSGTFDYYIVE